MVERIFRVFFLVFGAVVGFQTASYTSHFGLFGGAVREAGLSGWVGILIGVLAAAAGAFLALFLLRGFLRVSNWIALGLQRTPAGDIVTGVVGATFGLIIAVLLTLPFPRDIPIISDYLPILVTLFAGYLGMLVAVKKKEDLFHLFNIVPRSAERAAGNREKLGKHHATKVPAKLLDTSVIIDGRIYDVTKSGFLEGTLVVPGFVLEELQHIADSSDLLKRNRGRRGLDVLNRLQKEEGICVQVLDKDFDDLGEVDSKLVRLAKTMGAKVITNDFNLNKVCELQGVLVLNLNELANAVKPIVLPGEEMAVQVIKDGKESGQGVAYLDDGTMIVVDGGRRYIGETVEVLVTSVLQTSAGRMIFAKPKPLERAL